MCAADVTWLRDLVCSSAVKYFGGLWRDSGRVLDRFARMCVGILLQGVSFQGLFPRGSAVFPQAHGMAERFLSAPARGATTKRYGFCDCGGDYGGRPSASRPRSAAAAGDGAQGPVADE